MHAQRSAHAPCGVSDHSTGSSCGVLVLAPISEVLIGAAQQHTRMVQLTSMEHQQVMAMLAAC